MTISIKPDSVLNKFTQLTRGGLADKLARDGRMPPVSLIIKPLANQANNIVLDRFLSYSFSSSILIPVDTFSFSFVAPDGPPLNQTIREGDIVTLTANDVPIASGIIDSTEVETDREFGERGSITGRDLMGQLEDHDCVSLTSSPIWGNSFTVANGVKELIKGTRISTIELRDTPSSSYLLATVPGETKLAALQRFLEPLNCVAWMGPTGQIIIGRPNMSADPVGKLILSKSKRISNVLSMNVQRNAAMIGNYFVPIFSGQESITDRVAKQQGLRNSAPGPNRLFSLQHILPKAVVVSLPTSGDPQDQSGVNALKAAGGNILQAYAKREAARQNTREIIVQAVVPGHFNENGEPWQIDTCYTIEYDRGEVDEKMYLFQVEYQLSEEGGQITNLWFCRLGSIVSDVRAP